MIDIEDIQKTQEYYKLCTAMRLLDKNPKNIVIRIIPEKPNKLIEEVYNNLMLKLFFVEKITTQEMENLLLVQEEIRQYNENRDRLINAMQFYCKDPCNMTEVEYLKFISPYETDGTHEEIKKAAKQLSDWYKEEVYTKEYQKNRGQRW